MIQPGVIYDNGPLTTNRTIHPKPIVTRRRSIPDPLQGQQSWQPRLPLPQMELLFEGRRLPGLQRRQWFLRLSRPFLSAAPAIYLVILPTCLTPREKFSRPTDRGALPI